MRSDSHSPLPAPAGGSEVPCERSAARAASAGPALGSGSVSPDTGALFGVFVSPPSSIGKPAVPAPCVPLKLPCRPAGMTPSARSCLTTPLAGWPIDILCGSAAMG